MLRIGLLLRFCLVLSLTLGLCACGIRKPRDDSAGIKTTLKCPVSLSGLNQKQANGQFLRCEPDKDGTAFVDDFSALPDYQSIWLLIDTEKLQLEVKRGDETLAVFPNIAIGRNGAGVKSRRGDDITPLGEYKISWINEQSPFTIFYGLNYPSVENAREALSKGMISENEFSAIVYAHEYNQIPPQNTALGGQVGLHGLGKGDEKIHHLMNWTHGCIALTNNQLKELDPWISEGIRVKIK